MGAKSCGQVRGRRAGKPAGFKLQVMQSEPLRLQLVLPIDRRIGDAHAVNIEGQRRQMLVADQQVVEIGGAVLEADQIGGYPVYLNAVEYQLPLEQWPPCDIKPC